MRAQEFVVEYKTEEYNGLRFTTDINNGQLIVRALDDWGTNELGHVVFNIGDQDELDPQDLEVDDRYQGQGIAKTMYDYVRTLGYEIHRSWDQTPAGAGFWNKHRGEERVWEDLGGRNRSKIYDLLVSAIGSGPFDGGCVVMAQAIQKKHGGDIVVLVGHAQYDTNEVAQHAAVKLGNLLVDYDGPLQANEFIKRFERNELQHAGGHITGIRPIQNGDLPDAPRDDAVSDSIARLIK